MVGGWARRGDDDDNHMAVKGDPLLAWPFRDVGWKSSRVCRWPSLSQHAAGWEMISFPKRSGLITRPSARRAWEDTPVLNESLFFSARLQVGNESDTMPWEDFGLRMVSIAWRRASRLRHFEPQCTE